MRNNVQTYATEGLVWKTKLHSDFNEPLSQTPTSQPNIRRGRHVSVILLCEVRSVIRHALTICNVNQQMYTFQINVLIQFLASSTCFENHVSIIGKAFGICSFVWYVFNTEITITLYKISKYNMLSS
jgi:threonine/homoserine/homoserine lactone efflux protein